MRPVAPTALLLALLGLVAAPAPASGDWIRDAEGVCRYERSWRNVTRGPRALLNGAVYPVRSLVGSLFFSATACLPKWRCAPTIPFWIAAGPVWGAGRGAWWMVTGAFETVTLGQVTVRQEPIAPTEAVEVRFHPVLPMIPHGDPAGRCEIRRRPPPAAIAGGGGRSP